MDDLNKNAEKKGYRVFNWNVSAEGATGHTISSAEITGNILDGAKKKTSVIVLMHDAKHNGETAKALAAELVKSE